MDLTYLKEHICEELADAKEYANHAIELKPMAPTWGKMFIDMASAELTHASNLYKMFVEFYQKIVAAYKETHDYIEEMYKEVCHCYTTKSAEAKIIIDMYSR